MHRQEPESAPLVTQRSASSGRRCAYSSRFAPLLSAPPTQHKQTLLCGDVYVCIRCNETACSDNDSSSLLNHHHIDGIREPQPPPFVSDSPALHTVQTIAPTFTCSNLAYPKTDARAYLLNYEHVRIRYCSSPFATPSAAPTVDSRATLEADEWRPRLLNRSMHPRSLHL